MTNRQSLLFALLGSLGISCASAQVSDDVFAQGVLPLPQSMRAAAGVIDYDEDGNRITLRKSANNVECRVKDVNGHTVCYPKSMAARRDYSAKLAASGLEGDDLREAEGAAVAAGKIAPIAPGSMLYRLDETEGRMKLLWALILPDSVAANLGLSNAGRFTSAVAGKGTPWMMAENTPGSHVMIPINGTDLSNEGGAEAPLDTDGMHPFIRATLPLPADLRRETTVIAYDKDSGARKTLRQGSNSMICMPRDEESGFTRCAHKDNLAELDLRMKLAAKGESDENIDAAVVAAIAAGSIPDRKFGEASYRLYDGDDRLKLLWVIRLPGITSAETGLPTIAERENLGLGKGTPWLMREGTPRAHLMIPINGTELSNFY